MEVPLSNNNSIIISKAALKGIYDRLYDRVNTWAKSADSIQWTLAQNLRKTYKRVLKDEDFQRINPWHAECLILLAKNGIPIKAELLGNAIKHRCQIVKIKEQHYDAHQVVNQYLKESLFIFKKVQLLHLVKKYFIYKKTPQEQLHYKTVLQLCTKSLKSGVIKANKNSQKQYIKRLTWNIVLEMTESEDSIDITRDRLLKRCLIGCQILTNSLVALGASSESLPESVALPQPPPSLPDSHPPAILEQKSDQTIQHASDEVQPNPPA